MWAIGSLVRGEWTSRRGRKNGGGIGVISGMERGFLRITPLSEGRYGKCVFARRSDLELLIPAAVWVVEGVPSVDDDAILMAARDTNDCDKVVNVVYKMREPPERDYGGLIHRDYGG